MLAILVDHISWEACEARVLHRGVVPAAHVLAVLLQHLHRHRVEADQGLGCPGDDGRGAGLGEGLAGEPCLARLQLAGGVLDEPDWLVMLNFEADLVLITLHEGENGEDRVVGGARDGDGELVALVIKEVNESGE